MAIFKKYYLIILFFLTLVAFGQTLWMDVDRDDHAIFFKLDHLDEPAGYLGRGLFGEGAYKFSVTPYWFVYKLFGNQNIMPYYALNLVFIYLTAVCVSKLLGKRAGLLFIAGYIALDGFTFLAASMIINVSIIFTCLIFIYYRKYVQCRRSRDYLVALMFYFLAVYVTPVRTHYVLGLVILFELLYLFGKKTLIRLVPFLALFYQFYIIEGDKRTGQTLEFIKNVFSGELYNLYSFFGTLGYLFYPDVVFGKLANALAPILNASRRTIVFESAIVIFTSFVLWKLKKSKLLTFVFFVTALGWITVVSNITDPIHVSLFLGTHFLLFSSGVTLFLLFLYSLVQKNKWLFFLTIWMILNLGAYSSYESVNIYESTSRYLAHSFIPLVGILAILSRKNKIGLILISILGIANFYNSLAWQRNFLLTRSFPARKFYQQLIAQLPIIKKDDILYFDIAKDDESNFVAAFRVGQMPEETAVAWRYGLDRYDFSITTEFPAKVNPDKIQSFFYSDMNLINTTDMFRQQLLNPLEIKMQIRATLKEAKFNTHPVLDEKYQSPAFKYQKEKETFRKTAKLTSVTVHRDNVIENVLDGNIDTAWRSDRVLWTDNNGASLVIDLSSPKEINRLIWQNAYPVSTPTKYEIYTSLDNANWILVKKVAQTTRLDSNQLQVIEFPKVITKYVKVYFKETLNQDSPGIAELWLVSSELPIAQIEQFLADPLANITSQIGLFDVLDNLNNQLVYRLEWKDNQDPKHWKGTFGVENKIIIDGKIHEYRFVVPVRGTQMLDFRLSGSDIVNLEIVSSSLRHQQTNE